MSSTVVLYFAAVHWYFSVISRQKSHRTLGNACLLVCGAQQVEGLLLYVVF